MAVKGLVGGTSMPVTIVQGAADTPVDATNPLSVSHGQTFTAIADNRKVIATAGTAETLAATTACKEVTLTAMLANTGIVVVGGSTVVAAQSTRRGTPLAAGDSYTLTIDDLVKIYLDVTVSGEGVVYSYLL
jgi:hypothetical protein